MPSLPRIRRSHSRDSAPVTPALPPGPAELTAAGLTWIHVDAPRLPDAQELADRFAEGIASHPQDWHMLQPMWLADVRRTR